jgi:isopentenyl diphosphate isomerase/L-lactate dehydrogenase-like FMN-dependent dehydrogenase
MEPGAHRYFAGAGDERTLRRNAEAFEGWELRPRVLVGAGPHGEAGARAALEMLTEELHFALALLGCPRSSDLGADHVQRRRS